MKITETIERNCCQWSRDMLKYHGKPPKNYPKDHSIWFCTHCGQLWHSHRSPGEMDYGLEKLDIAWTGE